MKPSYEVRRRLIEGSIVIIDETRLADITPQFNVLLQRDVIRPDHPFRGIRNQEEV
jgi:hypothetical protein